MVGSLFMGCATTNKLKTAYKDSFTQKDLSNMSKVRSGMTQEQVLEIIGNPILSEINKNVEEWHYCDTGNLQDTYFALFFVDNQLMIKKYYSVTVGGEGGYGSCEKFIKKGDYKVPSEVQAILDKK